MRPRREGRYAAHPRHAAWSAPTGPRPSLSPRARTSCCRVSRGARRAGAGAALRHRARRRHPGVRLALQRGAVSRRCGSTSATSPFAAALPALALLPGKYTVRAHALDPEGLRLFDTLRRGDRGHRPHTRLRAGAPRARLAPRHAAPRRGQGALMAQLQRDEVREGGERILALARQGRDAEALAEGALARAALPVATGAAPAAGRAAAAGPGPRGRRNGVARMPRAGPRPPARAHAARGPALRQARHGRRARVFRGARPRAPRRRPALEQYRHRAACAGAAGRGRGGCAPRAHAGAGKRHRLAQSRPRPRGARPSATLPWPPWAKAFASARRTPTPTTSRAGCTRRRAATCARRGNSAARWRPAPGRRRRAASATSSCNRATWRAPLRPTAMRSPATLRVPPRTASRVLFALHADERRKPGRNPRRPPRMGAAIRYGVRPQFEHRHRARAGQAPAGGLRVAAAAPVRRPRSCCCPCSSVTTRANWSSSATPGRTRRMR